MGIEKMTTICNTICCNTKTTIQTKSILQSWFNNINPQYFLSVQFPKYLRSTDLMKSNQKLRKIMFNLEKLLLGRHWNRKHIPFVAVAEHGKSVHWHYHIYVYDCPFTPFEMQQKVHNLLEKLGLPQETLDIKPILTSGVYSYTSKEFITDVNYHFDSNRIITSEILFDLQRKSSTHIKG